MNKFSWSISQDSVFQECKRQYYYSRYGSWGGWEKNASATTKQLYLLKKLDFKAAWVGSRVHDSIKTIVEEMREGRLVAFDKAAKKLEDTMKRDYLDSRDNLFARDYRVFTRFFEHEYGLDFPPEEARALVDFGVKCLKNFYEGSAYEQLKKVRLSEWLFLDDEKPGEMDFEGTKVYVKPDAAFRKGERIILYDWKTGRHEDSDYSLQLGCYLLYAMSEWNAKPEDVDVFEVNLALDYVKEYPDLKSKLDWVKSSVRESIAEFKGSLKNADPVANVAEEESFPKSNDLSVCSRCEFLRVCKPPVLPEGKIPSPTAPIA